MSDSVVTTAGFSKSNLNQDISRVLDGQGKVDYLTVLSSCFPSRNFTLRDYSSSHSVKRRVKCVYLGSQDTVPLNCPRGWDLLVVMGVGFTRRECEDVTALLESVKSEESVVLGIPLQAMLGAAQLKELAAVNVLSEREPYSLPGQAQDLLAARRGILRKQLVERLHRALAPAAFRWMYKGLLLEEAPIGTRDSFFSGVMESIYTSSVQVHVPGSRRERFEALDELLGLAYELQLPSSSKRGGVRVIKDLLCRYGILDVDHDCGAYTTYLVHGALPPTSVLGPVWNALLADIVGDGKSNRSVVMKDLVKKYTSIPYGMSRSLIALLLAAVLRRFYPDLDLERDGEPVDPSGVALRSALTDNGSWELRYHPCSEHEAAFLRGVIDIFGTPEQATDKQLNLWDTALASMQCWFAALPKVAQVAQDFPGEVAATLAAFVRARSKDESSRDVFGVVLPGLCDMDGIPLEDGQEGLLNWLKQGRDELNGLAAWKAEKLVSSIAAVFGHNCSDKEESVEVLDGVFRQWFEKLHPGTEQAEVSEFAKALLAVYHSDAPLAERWFELLPQCLGISALKDWSADYTPTLVARVTRGRLELELWRVRALFPLENDAARRTETLRQWAREVLAGMRLDKREQESVLLDLLESMCWT